MKVGQLWKTEIKKREREKKKKIRRLHNFIKTVDDKNSNLNSKTNAQKVHGDSHVN